MRCINSMAEPNGGFCRLREIYGVGGVLGDPIFLHMADDQPQFQMLPPDCTCSGEGLVLVWQQPRVGGIPELKTYRCPECGHVETIETGRTTPKAP